VLVEYFSRQRAVHLQVGLSDGQEVGHDQALTTIWMEKILRHSNELYAAHIHNSTALQRTIRCTHPFPDSHETNFRVTHLTQK